jgi:prepilin-type N-terminal cleavage/methylation domain-containing protein
MTTTTDTSQRRSEAGFTLVELLAAMAISMLVLFATLTTLDTFSSNASRQTRLTDANEQVRSVVDRVVADLRQATTIEVADANDLVYTVTDSATQIRRERLCLDASQQLWRVSRTRRTASASPFTSGSSCPSSSRGVKVTQLKSVNSATNPMFRYDATAPSAVRSIGVTVSLDAGNGGRTDTSTLRASTFVRSKSETAAAVGDDDLTTTCNRSGQPTLTLSSGVGPLTVNYTDIDGNSLGSAAAGSSLQLSGAGTVIANITSSSGLVSQIVKVLVC